MGRRNNMTETEAIKILQEAVDSRKYPMLTPVYELAIKALKKQVSQKPTYYDKHGNKIWENDILKGYEYPFFCKDSHNYIAVGVWFDNVPAFGLYTRKNPKSRVNGNSEGNTELLEDGESDKWEVIGNIFDNPELLEVKP